MFFSNHVDLLKVKFPTILILSYIVCEMILVMAVPLPIFQAGGMVEDAARLGGAVKNSATGLRDASKGLDGISSADNLMGTSKVIDPALDSVSKLKNTGSSTLESGKTFDSASPVLNGKEPTTLPGLARPSGKQSYDGLVPTVMRNSKAWGTKATQSLSDASQAVRSKVGIMQQSMGKLKKLPKFSMQNFKSWFTRYINKARQVFSRPGSVPKTKTVTLGREPWSLKRIAGFFPIKSFKSLMTKFNNKAIQTFSQLKQALKSSPVVIGQAPRQFGQRIARLFPNKSFNLLKTRFQNLGKRVVERVQRFRQMKKVQPEQPTVAETQPGQLGKTTIPETQPVQSGQTTRAAPEIDPDNPQVPPMENFQPPTKQPQMKSVLATIPEGEPVTVFG
ncbi:hypothetical protein DFH28DRAFT_407240 [Melampsora americana]|nr:hypothetical protein DFH28DRAFT_407240 [Melampsora americana]